MTTIVTDRNEIIGDRAFSFDVLAQLVRDAGVSAYVEQTGGNCATVFAGTTVTESDGYLRWTCAGGPGRFTWDHPDHHHGYLAEFFIGPDVDDGVAISPGEIGARTLSDLSRLMAAQAAKAYGQTLNAEDIKRLGFVAP